MKIFALIPLILVCSCNQSNPAANPAQSQIDSLQRRLNQSYKPGLGEFDVIQIPDSPPFSNQKFMPGTK